MAKRKRAVRCQPDPKRAQRPVRDSGYKKNPPGHNRMCIVWELP